MDLNGASAAYLARGRQVSPVVQVRSPKDKPVATTPNLAFFRTDADVTSRILATIDALPDAKQQVVRWLEMHPKEAIHLPVKQIAAQIGVADATVVRTSQALGFSGIRELKLALATELAVRDEVVKEAIGSTDSSETIFRKVLLADAEAMMDTLASINPALFASAVDALLTALRIECYGCDCSLPLALDTAYRLSRLGLPASCFPDAQMQAMSARQLPAGSVVVAVSHTGRNPETIKTVRNAKESGALVILLTSRARTPLARLADIELLAATREIAFRTEVMARRVANLAVIDALFVAVAMRRLKDPSGIALAVDA